jgi:hypothetical protein
MAKRLSAVVGEYTGKDGQQKAEWVNVGALIIGKNGKQYALLDPSVNLAGVLVKQNVLAHKRGEQPSDMIMTSVFEDESNQQAPAQQGGYQQPQQPQYQQPAQGGYQQPQQGGYRQK